MTIVRLGITALATTLMLAGAANAFGLKVAPPSPGKLVPTSIQLGIISPPDNICPGNGKLTAWVETNKPGTVDILLVKKGGATAGPYSVTTVKGANGIVMGSYTQNLLVNNPIDAEYRVVVAGTPIESNWVPLVAEC